MGLKNILIVPTLRSLRSSFTSFGVAIPDLRHVILLGI